MIETLVLSPRYTPDSIALRKAALESGWHVERLNSYRVPESLSQKSIVAYGEALFVTILAQELNHILLEAPANYLMSLPQKYLQRELQFATLEEARKIENPRFIKPAEGKFFAAKVYQTSEELPPKESQAEGMPVYIGEPVKWLKEFRCLILERKLQTFSIYSRDGELAEIDGNWPLEEDEAQAIMDFCETFLEDKSIAMPPAFVLDIGEILERGWAIIETNPVWASGIYGCDPTKILPILKRACIPAEILSDEDKQWQIQRYSED